MIHVVAGVLVDPEDRVLIAQRPAGKPLAGFWEFPGGKLAPGEERMAGLARELREELGVTIETPSRPLLRLTHHYAHDSVLLDSHVVKRFRGEPRGLETQALRWCRWEELQYVGLLPADQPIVRALRLPERLVERRSAVYAVLAPYVLDCAQGDAMLLKGAECASVEQGIRSEKHGADFVVMQRELPPAEIAAWCATLSIPVYARGVGLPEAWRLGASGICEIGL